MPLKNHAEAGMGSAPAADSAGGRMSFDFNLSAQSATGRAPAERGTAGGRRKYGDLHARSTPSPKAS